MTQKTFSLIAGILFLAIAILHLSRLFWGWDAVVGGTTIPLWVNAVGFLLAAFLAYKGLKLSRSV